MPKRKKVDNLIKIKKSKRYCFKPITWNRSGGILENNVSLRTVLFAINTHFLNEAGKKRNTFLCSTLYFL